MIKLITNKFNNLDKKVKQIMVNGFKFSFIFCIMSIFVLLYYIFSNLPVLYSAGTLLFKSSILFFVEFIIFGIGFDVIKKQMA